MPSVRLQSLQSLHHSALPIGCEPPPQSALDKRLPLPTESTTLCFFSRTRLSRLHRRFNSSCTPCHPWSVHFRNPSSWPPRVFGEERSLASSMHLGPKRRGLPAASMDLGRAELRVLSNSSGHIYITRRTYLEPKCYFDLSFELTFSKIIIDSVGPSSPSPLLMSTLALKLW
jgi:hypothetical protein